MALGVACLVGSYCRNNFNTKAPFQLSLPTLGVWYLGGLCALEDHRGNHDTNMKVITVNLKYIRNENTYCMLKTPV